MSPINAVKSGLARYFDFRGRASRSEFWWFFLFGILAPLAGSLVDFGVFRMTGSQIFNPVSVSSLATAPGLGETTFYSLGSGLVGSLTWFALVIPSLSVGARRLHDIGRSGWWQLLWFIPLVGQILLVVWFCCSGERGPNRHGASPLATA
jgi:uncharacterized membrane protein YhaH (DUF805 family)